MYSPEISLGTYSLRSFSPPHLKIGYVPSETCAASVRPVEPQTRLSSSTAIT